MKKDADRRGAELAPISWTLGMSSGRGVVSMSTCWWNLVSGVSHSSSPQILPPTLRSLFPTLRSLLPTLPVVPPGDDAPPRAEGAIAPMEGEGGNEFAEGRSGGGDRGEHVLRPSGRHRGYLREAVPAVVRLRSGSREPATRTIAKSEGAS